MLPTVFTRCIDGRIYTEMMRKISDQIVGRTEIYHYTAIKRMRHGDIFLSMEDQGHVLDVSIYKLIISLFLIARC